MKDDNKTCYYIVFFVIGMSKHYYKILGILLLVVFHGIQLMAQDPATSADSTRNGGFFIMDADRSIFYNQGDSVRQILLGNFKAVQDSTFIYADSAEFFNNKIKAMSNVTILQGDTVRLFCDSLLYDGDTMMAYMYDRVVLENGSQQLFTDRLIYDAELKVAYYYDTAYLKQGTSVLTSLKGVFDIENEISDYYEYVTLTDKDFILRSDSLRYYNTLKKAVFKAPTRIQKQDIQIYCERGFYDVDDSIGVFKINAQFKEKEVLATADTIYYDGKLNTIRLLGNAKYINGLDTAFADEIKYNELTGATVLTGDAVYLGADRKAEGALIFYNKLTEDLSVEGESIITDKDKIIKGDTIAYDKFSGIGEVDGNVSFIDTSNNASIQSDHLDYRDKDEFFIAYNDVGKPVYSQEVEADSMHISADTLKSYYILTYIDTSAKIEDTLLTAIGLDSVSIQDCIELVGDSLDFHRRKYVAENADSMMIKDTLALAQDIDSIMATNDSLSVWSEIDSSAFLIDTSKFIIADGNVEIYKTDLQAVCDTLSYDRTDSLFKLMRDPVLWSDSTQFSGDTILIYMRNDEVDRVEILGNAMIISTTDLIYFNQIKGRRIDAYFNEGKIDSMLVSGNAQNVYYMQDKEDAYIGVNTTDCSQILFLFEKDEVSDIKFYKENDSHILPMDKTDHDAIKLEGFSWKIDRRPKGPNDIRA